MSTPLTPELTNHVEALRTERNWTRTDLAQRLGVSRQTLRAIENGRYAPSLSLALRIADAFERPLDALFTR